MAESNSLDEACKPDPSSTQSSGTAIVEDHPISGQETGSTVVDARETPQCLAGNAVGPAGFTTAIGESSPLATDILINDEEEAREIVHFASWLMAEQKAQLSLLKLDRAIVLFRQVLDGRLPTHPLYSNALRDLASGLDVRFMHTNQLSDLVESLKLRTEILSILRGQRAGNDVNTLTDQQEDEDDIEATLELANGLLNDFNKSTSPAVLDTVIVLLQQALKHLWFGDATRTMALVTLVEGLYARRHFADMMISDLNTGVSILQEAIRSSTDREQENRLGLQTVALLLERFNILGDKSDLRSALDYLKILSDYENSVTQKLQSAKELLEGFPETGNMDDLNDAIKFLREIMSNAPQGSEKYNTTINNLASALRIRFEQGGQQSDLDEAMLLHRLALELRPPPHPGRYLSLNNLANALQTRFEQNGQQNDLDEAISLHRQALELRPPPHPDQSLSLNNLASVLWTRFEQGGLQSDLDEAISLHRQAFELLPPSHPDRSMSLNNLANTVWTRFSQGGQQSDLDEAISLHRQALELRPPPHPNRSSSFNNLASALCTRFEQGGQQSDLDEAISLHRQALELRPPPHPDRSMSLNNLANALKTRFSQGGQQSDLDEAISLHRQALELRAPPHPNRSSSLNNLANTLETRFQQGCQQSDLGEAISLHRQALGLRPPPHSGRSRSLNNLAFALQMQFNQGGHQSDLDEVILTLRTSTQYHVQHPSRRFDMSKHWIRIAADNGHDSLIAAYEAALQILPQVAALTLTVELRQKTLISRSDGLARDASQCAIRSGDLAKSVEFLEAGRSVIWSQILSLRSPFDQLCEITPDGSILADRLQFIARELEIGSHRDVFAHILDNHSRLSIDQESSRLNRLSEEWEETILKVRNLPGYEDFLLTPRLSSLQTAASTHPIVLLVANSDESHCLIVTSTHIRHIPLPSLQTPILEVLVENTQMASSSSIPRSLIDKTRRVITEILGEERGISYQDHGDSDSIFRFVLGMLWDEIVKPIIDCLNIKKYSDEFSTFQWCPTGYFTFLPIHAAGIYDANNSAIDCATDYFISSYTPTISILLAEPSESLAPSQAFKMMTVIQSSQGLHSTTLELERIQSHVPDRSLIAMGIPGLPASVETVASQLPGASIVHFACHGHQDTLQPLNSGLELHDGQLRISRIMKEKMPNGALAFLSACETAMGDKNLPDEAMSIAASLLFCGFRRVVATMWMMMDEDGPTIADAFYRELFRGSDGEKSLIPDVTKSAYALHVAVKELRSRKVSFRRWVPFIHMGQC